ncbi:hypothetical protein AKL02_001580 [Thioclava electrotropha]|uniref:Mutator family transposase n=1 Tax=Thioclava electrotropha TaxID=1549850 RepID=A0ABX6YPU1_9RHOB|nr:hypothetical protein AKL02_001580 [Thioclava electrotropha]
MNFPSERWAQIPPMNPLKRVNRGFKRRSGFICIFPNDEAITRLVGALMLEINDEWTVARRYVCLEALARSTDNSDVWMSSWLPDQARTFPKVDTPTPLGGAILRRG